MHTDHMPRAERFTVAHGAVFRSVGDHIRWSGHRFQVVDVAPLAPGYEQVVLAPLDRRGLPVSLPAHDLVDAIPA